MGFKHFETTSYGLLPAGTDIPAVLTDGDERELHAVWNTYHHNASTTQTLGKLADDATDTGAVARVAFERDLAEHAVVTPAQALAANRRLVDLLTGRRWSVMRDAREAGDSWTVIGDALDMTKQGAVDWYKRKIAAQEKYVGKFHDTDRARAAVTEEGSDR